MSIKDTFMRMYSDDLLLKLNTLDHKAIKSKITCTNSCYTNIGGQTPLHIVAVNGDFIALEMMLAFKPDLNRLDMSGLSPLHLAVYHGHSRLIDMMLETAKCDFY